MKKTAILILIILTIVSTINGMEFCGIKKGLYIDVKTSVYELYKSLEIITNNYIQVDSNKDFEIFTPDYIKINHAEAQRCFEDMQQNKNILCD